MNNNSPLMQFAGTCMIILPGPRLLRANVSMTKTVIDTAKSLSTAVHDPVIGKRGHASLSGLLLI
jgi:hypothetical protein